MIDRNLFLEGLGPQTHLGGLFAIVGHLLNGHHFTGV